MWGNRGLIMALEEDQRPEEGSWRRGVGGLMVEELIMASEEDQRPKEGSRAQGGGVRGKRGLIQFYSSDTPLKLNFDYRFKFYEKIIFLKELIFLTENRFFKMLIKFEPIIEI